MTVEEYNEWTQTEEGRAVQPNIDKRVTDGISKYQENHPLPADLLGRLKTVEEGLDKKDVELTRVKMDNYLYKECVKKDLPYELLQDGIYKDQDAVNDRIALFQKTLGDRKSKELNKLMATESYQPGSGQVSQPKPDLKNMSRDEMIFREEMGNLDDAIES